MLEATNNYIIDTVIRIDKLQKEAEKEENACVSCETSLNTRAFDTIPVSFTSCCCGMPFTANLDLKGTPTPFFRIESIRDCKFVTLRLLEAVECHEPHKHKRKLVGTNFTCILDLSCVGLLQCYEAINVNQCNA